MDGRGEAEASMDVTAYIDNLRQQFHFLLSKCRFLRLYRRQAISAQAKGLAISSSGFKLLE